MSAPDLDALYDEAVGETAVRQVFGVERQPDPSGLLGSEPVAVTAAGEVDEEALYRQHMKRHFPQASVPGAQE